MAVPLFIDASAIVAIINREKEASHFIQKLESADKIYSSAISKYETAAALCLIRKHRDRPAFPELVRDIQNLVDLFFEESNITLIPIGEDEAALALTAYRNYGKGTGAKANLNMGDCFSYACGKSRSLPLLFKGNDFIHTDIARA